MAKADRNQIMTSVGIAMYLPKTPEVLMNKVAMRSLDANWSDIGSWYSLYSILTKNKDNSHHTGNVISIKSENNLVISPKKLTAVIGIKNMTIINLADATLIVPHSESEAVKDVVQMLRTMNKSEYL